MQKRLFVPAFLFLLVGCLDPKVVPTTQSDRFQLSMLSRSKVAFWPLATTDLDESAAQTVAKEYPSRARFMDAFSSRLSRQTLALGAEGGLASEAILELLGRDPGTRSLLDPAQLLGTQDPNNRFAAQAPAPGLEALSRLPALQGIQFILVPRNLAVGRQVIQGSAGGGAFKGNGGSGGLYVGGQPSSAQTSGCLRLAIIDLPARAVVWDGSVYASASSSFMKATALHEVEEELVANFTDAVAGRK